MRNVLAIVPVPTALRGPVERHLAGRIVVVAVGLWGSLLLLATGAALVDGGQGLTEALAPVLLPLALAASCAWVLGADTDSDPSALLLGFGHRPATVLLPALSLALVVSLWLLSGQAPWPEAEGPVPAGAAAWPLPGGGWGPPPDAGWTTPSSHLGWTELVARSLREPPAFAHLGRDREEILRRLALILALPLACRAGLRNAARRGANHVAGARGRGALRASFDATVLTAALLAVAGYSSTL